VLGPGYELAGDVGSGRLADTSSGDPAHRNVRPEEGNADLVDVGMERHAKHSAPKTARRRSSTVAACGARPLHPNMFPATKQLRPIDSRALPCRVTTLRYFGTQMSASEQYGQPL
jgi:hypothetical protein